MAFWDLFKSKKNDSRPEHGELHQKVVELLPSAPEERRVRAACIAGLMARVAWCDMDIHRDEIAHMNTALQNWLKLSPEESRGVVTLAEEHMREFAGLENHKYADSFNQLSDESQRYELLKVLFALAASDGTVAQKEVEEIRLIGRSLLLEHRHFVAAKGTVLDYLASLQKGQP